MSQLVCEKIGLNVKLGRRKDWEPELTTFVCSEG